MSASKPISNPTASVARFRSALAVLLLGLTLTACNDSGGTGPGGVSEGEAQALDEAAEMLDARRLPEGTLPTVATPPSDPDADPTETAEVTGDTPE